MKIIEYRVISIVLFVIVLCSINQIAHGFQDNTEPEEDKVTNEEPIKQNVYPKEFTDNYMKMFKTKRMQQQDAVKRLMAIKDHKKSDMFKKVLEKLFQTLYGSLEKLSKFHESSTAKDGRIQFDQSVANELSTILENTAFCADLSLHFSKMFHKMYDKVNEWHTILETSIAFTLNSNLIDKETIEAINLMSQELNIIERSPNYVNPYKRNTNNLVDEQETEQENEKKKTKKKEKRKRGPGLSGGKNEL